MSTIAVKVLTCTLEKFKKSGNDATSAALLQDFLGVLGQSDLNMACLQQVSNDKQFEVVKSAAQLKLPNLLSSWGSGLCLLTKHEVVSTFLHQFLQSAATQSFGSSMFYSGCFLTVVRVDGLLVHVYNVHLEPRCSVRRSVEAYEASEFISATSSSCDLVLVCADLRPTERFETDLLLSNAFLLTSDAAQSADPPQRCVSIFYRANAGVTVRCVTSSTQPDGAPFHITHLEAKRNLTAMSSSYSEDDSKRRNRIDLLAELERRVTSHGYAEAKRKRLALAAVSIGLFLVLLALTFGLEQAESVWSPVGVLRCILLCFVYLALIYCVITLLFVTNIVMNGIYEQLQSLHTLIHALKQEKTD